MGQPRRARTRIFLTAMATMFMVLAGPAGAADEGELAWAVKATFLYKLVPFVDWPPAAFASADSPLNICVVGDDAFGNLVSRAASGQTIGDRTLVARNLASIEPNDSCHVAYVAGGAQAVPDALENVRGHPTLTVTDAARGETAGGVVHFVIYNGRVRFEIDLGKAQEQGIAVSSKVLELAVRVQRP